MTTPSDNPHVPSPRTGSCPAPWGWLLVVVLTAAMTTLTTSQSLRRYEELRSGWSWDLAYYNQWYWALTFGDQKITVRPIAAYAQEGPSVWKMNYLSPLRFTLVPIYRLFPDPRTLLVLQNLVFWWVIPAAYGLVRAESGSEAAAISAAALVPLTPLLWPLAWNDFRELQFVTPFVLWAVRGVRERSVGWTAIGIGGMLACRQEFAIAVMTFALLPPRRPESLTVSLRWRDATILLGLGWIVFGFFGYLQFVVGHGTPNAFIDQFLGPRASLAETTWTAAEALVLGLGGWAFLMLLAPRTAVLALPWIWSLCNGRWALRFLSTTEWHHVRYAMPMVAFVLAAGLVGYARLAARLIPLRFGRLGLAAVWILAAGLGVLGLRDVSRRLEFAPIAFDRREAAEIQGWIRQVAPDDAVLADYDVSAPLSSRRRLYSNKMEINLPPGFPKLDPEFRWLFVRNNWGPLNLLLDQGFSVVYRGPHLTVAHRRSLHLAGFSNFFRFRANNSSR